MLSSLSIIMINNPFLEFSLTFCCDLKYWSQITKNRLVLFIVGKTLFSFQFISLMLELKVRVEDQNPIYLFITLFHFLVCCYVHFCVRYLFFFLILYLQLLIFLLLFFHLLFFKWFCTNALTTSTSMF